MTGATRHPRSIWLVPLAAAGVAAATAAGLAKDGALPAGMIAHAAAMLTAWNLLLPAGGVVARHYKVTRRQGFPAVLDNRFWWAWHQGLQYAGVATAALGLLALVAETGWALRTEHAWLGLLVLTGAAAQIVSGWLRGSKGGPTDPAADPARPSTWRGDHYDMTRRRRAFERVHKAMGWGVLALSCASVLSGIALLGWPPWLTFAAGLLQGAIVCALLDGAIRGRRVDTYTAIWGVPPPPCGDAARGAQAAGAAGRPR